MTYFLQMPAGTIIEAAKTGADFASHASLWWLFLFMIILTFLGGVTIAGLMVRYLVSNLSAAQAKIDKDTQDRQTKWEVFVESKNKETSTFATTLATLTQQVTDALRVSNGNAERTERLFERIVNMLDKLDGEKESFHSDTPRNKRSL